MKKIIAGIAFLILFVAGMALIGLMMGRDPVYSERDKWFDQLSLNANGYESITDIFCYTYKDEGDTEHHCMFMPSSADMEKCIVKFLYADHIEIDIPESGSTVYKNNSVVTGLKKGGEYMLRFEDAGGNVLKEGVLSIMSSDGLPAVFIENSSGNMDQINADKEHRESGKILITDETGDIDTVGKLEYIKGHGNTSWEMIKKAYQFKFPKEMNVLGLGRSKKWVMTANYDYASEEKNALVYDMAAKMGMKGTPKFKFADIYFNGQYQGLYLVGGKIEYGSDRLDINDLEYMNKLINDSFTDEDHETYPAAGERIGYDIGGDPADITGGYILERDYSMMGKLLDHASRFATKRGDTYGIKQPYIATKEEADYIADVFQRLEDGAYSGSDISDIADMESFADKYLLEELVKNSAAGSTSTYFYKDSDSVDGRIHAGPAWDYDKALGHTRIDLADDPTTFNFCTIHPDTSYLFYELYMNNSDYRELVRNEYIEKFRPYLTDAVADGGMIDSIRDEYSRNNNMDAIRWSKPDEDYIVHAEWIRDFLKERIKAADRLYIDREPLEITKYTDIYDSLHIIACFK